MTQFIVQKKKKTALATVLKGDDRRSRMLEQRPVWGGHCHDPQGGRRRWNRSGSSGGCKTRLNSAYLLKQRK